MKVAIISHSAVVGPYRRKYHAMAEQGCQVHLILPAGWPEGFRWVPAPAPGREENITLHVLPIRLAGRVGAFFLPGLGRMLKELRPDLVSAEEEPFSLACAQAGRAAQRLGVPWLFFTWENLRRRYRWPMRALDQWNRSHAAGAIAGTPAAAAVLRERGFDRPLAVAPQYGVDPKIFRPLLEIRSRDERPYRIGYFGRLVPEKGLSTLLAAARLLDFPFELAITGRGPAERSLRRHFGSDLGRGRVVWQPAVDAGHMPAAYNGVDAAVLPSEDRPDWKEQFGRVLIEAMACGTPVVGSDGGEIPQVIGPAGLIFPQARPEALARCLTRLRQEPGLAEGLALAGRARVLAGFTHQAVAKQTVDHYRKVVNA